jgi:TusA-related sulfurtransferase
VSTGSGSGSGPADWPAAALVVDAMGLRCPMPVLELARQVAAAGLPAGSDVEVLSDDPAAAADVPAWAQMRGHDYVGSADGDTDGATRYRVRLGA